MAAPITARLIAQILLESLRSRTSRSFRKRYARLPPDVQEYVRETYHSWITNPFLPTYRFKALEDAPKHWSVSIGRDYRALAYRVSPDLFVFHWVGTHEEYNRQLKLIRSRTFSFDLA